jgi:hypothetical protein
VIRPYRRTFQPNAVGQLYCSCPTCALGTQHDYTIQKLELTNAYRSADQTFVPINIGGNKKEPEQAFLFQPSLVCKYSAFFFKAFRRDFLESKDKAIHLPDVTASTLRLFQFWLYGQSTRPELFEIGKEQKPVKRNRRVEQKDENATPMWIDQEGELCCRNYCYAC